MHGDGHDTWEIQDFELDVAHTVVAHRKWHSNNWNRDKLSKMLHLKFPSFDQTGKKAYDFIEDGDLPDDAIEQEEKIIDSGDPIEPCFEDPDNVEDDRF